MTKKVIAIGVAILGILAIAGIVVKKVQEEKQYIL